MIRTEHPPSLASVLGFGCALAVAVMALVLMSCGVMWLVDRALERHEARVAAEVGG